MNLIRRPTSMATYRPRGIDDPFGRMVESMVEDMFAPFLANQGESVAAPRINVRETEKSFEIEAEMPGVKKEDVKVSVENQRVTIEAESKRDTEERAGENVVYSEHSARRYMRSFTLPTDVDEGAAQAHLDNGMLVLSLPKKQAGAATRLTVQ